MFFSGMYVDHVDIAMCSSTRLQSEYSGQKWQRSTSVCSQTVSNTVELTINHQYEIAYR